MKIRNRENLKGRILRLARLKCTGSPAELACTLDISERSVKRIIREIRLAGHEIRFCPARKSYVTGYEYV